MLPRGYIDEPRPKPTSHLFKVPIQSRAWFSRGTVRQAQRFGSIAATLVSNPSGEEPRPSQAAHIATSGHLQPWPGVTDSPKWFHYRRHI